MARIHSWLQAVLIAFLSLVVAGTAAAQVRFAVTVPAEAAKGPITGRLIVTLSKSATPEPRLTIGSLSLIGQPIFGMDVEAMKPGQPVFLDERAAGFPDTLDKLPAGDYHVQAVLIPYTFAKRSDGHRIWVPYAPVQLPMSRYPGNLYSKTKSLRIDPGARQDIALTLTEAIAPVAQAPDTPWIKRVRIKSKILSDFWGFPMTIGADVLLPKGFAENPDARYPAIYTFGHRDAPFRFDTDPASDTEQQRAAAADANVETGYQFAREWMGERFPRMVAIAPFMPSPYFVESYAVNSANNGPWGDAFTKELMPYLERTFRLIAAPHGRVVEGASTGGWEALALQLHYPDHFGGAWVFNPDPIDFSRYQTIDIYNADNMYTTRINDWVVRENPMRRTREGLAIIDFRDLGRLEAVMGSKGRSSYQFDIWQATHGPVGNDGYPVLLFDKTTGAINKDVVKYMRENGYDLSAHLRDNWDELSPRLRNKIKIFTGDMDDFYLNLAVYQFEDMIREKGGGSYPARFEYGRPKKGHNWHHTNWAGVVREVAGHVRETAPAGTSFDDWNY